MFRCKPADEELAFDGTCNNLYDLACEADCVNCLWGFPKGDPAGYASEDATCYCPVEDIREVTWGGECGRLDDDLCGSYCTECRWSRIDDKNGLDDPTCRCRNWW